MIRMILFVIVLAVILIVAFRRAGPMSVGNFPGFVAGFLGWFVINTLLWGWVLDTDNGAVILNPFKLLPLCLNIPVLFVLSLRRRWIFLGGLAAILVNAIGILLFTVPGPYTDQRLGKIITMTPFFLSFLRSIGSGTLFFVWMALPVSGFSRSEDQHAAGDSREG